MLRGRLASLVSEQMTITHKTRRYYSRPHIIQICKATFYHIHDARRISKFLSEECLQTLVHSHAL